MCNKYPTRNRFSKNKHIYQESSQNQLYYQTFKHDTGSNVFSPRAIKLPNPSCVHEDKAQQENVTRDTKRTQLIMPPYEKNTDLLNLSEE